MEFKQITKQELDDLLDLVLKMDYREWCKFRHCVGRQFDSSIGNAVINDKERLQLAIEMEL